MVVMWTMLAMVAMMQTTAMVGSYVKLESFITLGMRNHFGASHCAPICGTAPAPICGTAPAPICGPEEEDY